MIEDELKVKHGNQPTIDPQVRNSVINSILRIESHYLRAQTTREFICNDKSVANLYRDYKTTCKQRLVFSNDIKILQNI